jgi:hypothetical protein
MQSSLPLIARCSTALGTVRCPNAMPERNSSKVVNRPGQEEFSWAQNGQSVSNRDAMQGANWGRLIGLTAPPQSALTAFNFERILSS